MAGFDDLIAGVEQVPSYFFADRKPGDPLSYQSVLARRKIAESLLGRRSPFPKNIGEGLTYFGEALADRRMLNQLDAAERARQGQIDKAETDAPSESGLAAPAVAPAAAPAAAPAPAAALAATSLPPPTPTSIGPLGNPFSDPNVNPVLSGGFNDTVGGSVPTVPYRRSELVAPELPTVTGAAQPSPAGIMPSRGFSPQVATPLGDPRSGLTRTLLAQRGVIPPDPTEGAEQPPRGLALAAMTAGDTASDAIPIGMPGEQVAQAAPPTDRFSPGNPPTVVDIKPMLEAGGAPAIPALPQNMPQGFKMSEPVPPTVPGERPKSARELYGERIYMQGVKTGDPQMQQLGQTIAAPLKAARDHLYARDVEAYKAGMSHYTAMKTLFLKQQMEEQDKSLATNKSAQELAALPEELRQKVLKGQLEITSKIRELEGEGFVPLTAAQMGSLNTKPPEGQIVYMNRRGELKFGPRPPNAQTINVDQKATEKGMEAIETHMGNLIVEQHKEGIAASDDLQTLAQMRALSSRVATGPVAVAKQFAGRFGIKTEGVSDVEALNAMINRIVPQQRVPGTGATSDFDASMFQASVPQLMNTPQGNQMIMDTMESVARNKIARSEIAGKVISRQMTIAQSIPEFMKLQQEAKGLSDRVRLYLESTGTKLPEAIVPSQQQTDDAARAWLRANPNHPSAAGVRKGLELGGK
jgi:hypothetical protein